MFLLASPLVSRTIGQRRKRNLSEVGFMPLVVQSAYYTYLRYTHTAEFSEFFLRMQRGTQLHFGNRLAGYICWEGTKFIGRIDRNSLASDWLLEKK